MVSSLPSQPLCDGSLFGDYVFKQDLESSCLFADFFSLELRTRIVTSIRQNLIFGEILWVHYPKTFQAVLLFETEMLKVVYGVSLLQVKPY
jgi:hypothetical protein